jgi:hypothetical protein
MSEQMKPAQIKHLLRRRWPSVVTEALREYDPGEAALMKLERETHSPAQMAMMLRIAAITHQVDYPRDVNHHGWVN